MKIYPQEDKTERELEVERDYVEVKKSKIPGAGVGVFAKKDIRAGEDLGFYRGEWLQPEEYAKDNRSITYTLRLANGTYVDAEHNGYNFISRINAPKGTGMKSNLYWNHEGRTIAKRNIKAGEELLVGYGALYWRGIKKNTTLKKKMSKRNTTVKNKI